MSVSKKLRNSLQKRITEIAGDGRKFGVAVSGGGDSVALLHMLLPWAKENQKKLFVVTVNHNLRADSYLEANSVQELCAKYNVNHAILEIQEEVSGNLQSWARKNRYRLISEWANGKGIESVFLGHTSDDQAETFLLRLARGSGVDGLSAMTAKSYRNCIYWLRPLLNVSRKELRNFLNEEEISYFNDPSNQDLRFDRIKVRKVLASSHEYGLETARLVETSHRMSQARDVLNQVAFQFAKNHVFQTKIGTVAVDLPDLKLLFPDTRYRILSYLVKWVSGNTYGARAKTLENTVLSVMEGKSRTCCGCVLSQSNKKLHVSREFNAVKNSEMLHNIWDGRWSCPDNFSIRACGEKGLEELKDWKMYMLPRHALLAMPTIWHKEKLFDHLLNEEQSSKIRSIKNDKDFYTGILSS